MAMQNYHPDELAKFAQLSSDWWDPNGSMKALHHINPVRFAWIQQQVDIENKKVADIGCGGGLLSEALAKARGNVTAIDLTQALITVAQQHQQDQSLAIDYRCISVEQLAEQQPAQFDTVTCMEMLEHVPDPKKIIGSISQLLKPNGKLIVSTLNRTLPSYFFAIVIAEYLLKIVPFGTHQHSQFIRPHEMQQWAEAAGLKTTAITGYSYQPFSGKSELTKSVAVNYMMSFVKLA